MSVQTMATRINSQNLPLVQACLAEGFLNVPPVNSYGCYLVINEIVQQMDSTGRPLRTFAIDNSWYKEDAFFELYRPLQEPDNLGFFPVELAVAR